MRRRAALGAAFVGLLAGTAAAAEDVNLSKYRLRVTNTLASNPAFAAVGQSELETRCRDKDGCAATLIIEKNDYVVGATAVRLFMAPGDHSWISRGAATVGPTVDGDLSVDQAAQANSFDSSIACAFTDSDPAGEDLAVGFILAVFRTGSPTQASCTLVLED